MSPSPKPNEIPLFHLQVSLDNPAIAAIADQLGNAVRDAVHNEFGKLAEKLQPTPESSSKPAVSPPGVDLPTQERLRATDLRTALLLGKIPEDSGLLIDAKAVAKLLDISYRTLYRLLDEKAVPGPVALGGSMKKWRLAEILQWVESDCPPQKHWTYSALDTGPRRKGR